MTIKFIFSVLLVLPAAPGLRAQTVSFDSLYHNTSELLKAAPRVPAPAGAKTPGTAAAASATDGPELAYENLMIAPVWRSQGAAPGKIELKEGFSPAKNQGKRNMCNVFAAAGLAEYLVWKKEGNKPDFSEEFLYYNAKINFTGRPELEVYKKEDGLAGYVAVDTLRGGVVRETDWPFQPVLAAHTPPPPLLDQDVALPPPGIYGKKLGYEFSPVAIRRGEIGAFLASEKKPVVINLMLYMDGIDNASGRISDPSETQRKECFSSGKNCGGHVVLLTGYDPAAHEYFFRNSWGPSWGAAGSGRISEKYLMENCESCHHIPKLASFDAGSRAMVVNSSYGWSAVLK